MAKGVTFAQLCGLLIIAALLWFGGNFLYDEYQVLKMQRMLTTTTAVSTDQLERDVNAHIARCVEQGHRGDGC